jgi:ABC-2 type transport system ATP-binding protein
VAILRDGRLVHTQVMSQLRRQHRIRARLAQSLPPVPKELKELVSIQDDRQGQVVIDTADQLAPILGWLATLPIDEVKVEPIGLQVVYDRYHRSGESPATDPKPLSPDLSP